MIKILSPDEYQEKYSGLLLNGVDSLGTYIPLLIDDDLGINIAVRPLVARLSPEVVLFGVKLRVGYTVDTNHQPLVKNIDISYNVKRQRLIDACLGFSWLKRNSERVSTIAGFGLAASDADGESIRELLVANSYAKELLNRLNIMYQKENEEEWDITDVSVSALHDGWLLESIAQFKYVPALPDGVVGQHTDLLVQGADTYKSNVVDFKKKIKDWSEAAADEQDNDSE
jgi:hypothetical protein